MDLRKLYSGALLASFCLGTGVASHAADLDSRPLEADYVLHDFHFASGETLPEVRIHYTYFGKPKRDVLGRVTNAVLIMHGTAASSTRDFPASCSRKAAF
jgi:homoserine O-acetyltransferase/O-succinyltransferase